MKVTSRFLRWSALATSTALASAAALVAGCGGGDDLGPATTGVLSGTAATGAPITGGRVDVACASGAPLSATTSSTGTYEVALQGQALPCKLKVSGGSLASGVAYHSVALQTGTVNLTPLTDLVVARMAGGAPSAWFSAIAAADFQKLTADAVNTALGAITTGLGLATPLGGKNPMTAGFEAKTTDPLDKVLEAIKAAAPSHATLLTAAQGTNWSTLAQTYVAAINAALAGAASGGTTNPVSGGGTGSVPTVSLGACAANPTPGTYSMVVETTVSGLGSVPVPTVCINNIATTPASESAFCGDATIKQQLPPGITLESCKYDAAKSQGTIAAKITTPVAISYTVTYTFVKR